MHSMHKIVCLYYVNILLQHIIKKCSCNCTKPVLFIEYNTSLITEVFYTASSNVRCFVHKMCDTRDMCTDCKVFVQIVFIDPKSLFCTYVVYT